jgi:hypothetical protein
MTTRELLALVGHSPTEAAIALALPVLLALALGLVRPRGGIGRHPLKYAYSAALFAASAFGMMAIIVDGYTLFFTRDNLLDTNPLVTIAPIVSMVVTFGLVGRQVDFRDLPGFDRLSGLLLMVGAACLAVFLLSRMHVMVMFHGQIGSLLLIGVAIVVVLRLGTRLAFGRRARKLDRV